MFNANTIESVVKEQRLIYFHNGKGLRLLKPNQFLKIERDDIFVRAGGIVTFKIKSFLKNKKIYKDKIGHMIIDKKSSFSINSDLEFQLANKM